MRSLEKCDNENCVSVCIHVKSCNSIYNPNSEHTFLVCLGMRIISNRRVSLV